MMHPETLHIHDTPHVIDRLRHTKDIMHIPDLTSYCSAAAFTAVFGPEAYPPSLLVTEQSLTANEQTINEAATLINATLYVPHSAQSFLSFLNHPYAQGALFLTAENTSAHVTAVVPSELRTANQEEPIYYYAIDTGAPPFLSEIGQEGALDMYITAHACFVVARNVIPQRLQEE